jgi:hypothetical protein
MVISKMASVSAEMIRSSIGWETGERALKAPGFRETGQNGHNIRIIGGFGAGARVKKQG